jgi:SAM-dependent methyltransferase
VIWGQLGQERWRVLDVACGTGEHIRFLRKWFEMEGLDRSPEMLRIAEAKNPGLAFHCQDMAALDLGSQFDAILCLFSSIGYLKTLPAVGRALAGMARHLRQGGVLIVEPWLSPETWHSGHVDGQFIDEPELKIARLSTSLAEGRLSYFDLHYLVATPEGTRYFVEHHELGLFTVEEMRGVMAECGLDASYDAHGLTGRGLHVGRKL